MQRQGGEAGLPMGQLGFDRSPLAVQFPPLGVDHRPLGLRNLLRAILVKQINGKVLHHVAEEVFLGPSTEQPSRIPHPRLAEGRADQAHLVPTGGQLADLPHPEPVLRSPIHVPRSASFNAVVSPLGSVSISGELGRRPSRPWDTCGR